MVEELRYEKHATFYGFSMIFLLSFFYGFSMRFLVTRSVRACVNVTRLHCYTSGVNNSITVH